MPKFLQRNIGYKLCTNCCFGSTLKAKSHELPAHSGLIQYRVKIDYFEVDDINFILSLRPTLYDYGRISYGESSCIRFSSTSCQTSLFLCYAFCLSVVILCWSIFLVYFILLQFLSIPCLAITALLKSECSIQLAKHL